LHRLRKHEFPDGFDIGWLTGLTALVSLSLLLSLFVSNALAVSMKNIDLAVFSERYRTAGESE
jgi:hypothetical protein